MLLIVRTYFLCVAKTNMHYVTICFGDSPVVGSCSRKSIVSMKASMLPECRMPR